MTDNLSNRIYRAQTLGNVEPIEYMTPYPNLHALVEGQNVKHHGKMIYADLGMTNLDFYTQVQKIANWLVSTGLKPKETGLDPSSTIPPYRITRFCCMDSGCFRYSC